MKKFLTIIGIICLGLSSALAQTVQVTGTVTGADDGEPLPGVSVVVKGTLQGTVTNTNGKYSFDIPSNATLQFSFVGMVTQEIAVGGRQVIDVVMQASTREIDEVVVVAYGTAKKSAFTGSASTVKSEALARRQTSNVTNALAGQVAGVQVTSSDGQPGRAASIRIRGVGSLNASNSPLYVVDGVPYDGNLSAINSMDIETITVLKDAAANAIYGARGANGVVLVTTKKGKSGVAKVTVDARFGNNSRAVPAYNAMTDPAMYYETFYKGLYNSKIQAGSSESDAQAYARKVLLDANEGGLGYQIYTVPDGEYLIGTNGKLNPKATLGYSDGTYYYTPDDWYDEIFGNGNLRQEYNASVAGSTEKMSYYFSAGYLDDTGIIQGSGFTRYTGRISADYQAKKWLKVGANLGYTNYDIQAPSYQTSWGSSGNLFYATNLIAPIYPLYVRNPDGKIRVDSNGITVYDYGTSTNQKRAFMGLSNPAGSLQLDKSHALTDVLTGKWYALFDIIEGLQFNASIGTNVINQRTNSLDNPFYGNAVSIEGAVSVSHNRIVGINQQYLLTYKKKLGSHSFDFLAGYESYHLKMQELYGQNKQLYNPDIAELSNAIYSPPTGLGSSTNSYATEGFLGRVQYDYDEKYFASVSYRRDASSRFAPENRWGNFGSIGGAWVISKENFFQNLYVGWVNFLKLKASFGIQGNDDLLNYYPYQDQFTVANDGTGSFAVSFLSKGNKDITWETSYNFNGGFEFNLFDERLNGSIEYFSRKSVDLLFNQPVPISLGYPSIPINQASMRNKGVEIDLNARLFKNENIEWNFNVNATAFKNEILDLPESAKKSGVRYTMTIWDIGGSRNDAFLREYAGVDPTSGKALYYKVDGNGDYVLEDGNKTTTDDWSATYQRNLGNTFPKLYGGFGTSVNFYGFDLSLAFSYQLGGKGYDSSYEEMMHSGDGAGQNWHMDILKAWSEENPNSDIPRLNALDDTYQKFSSRFLISSNFLCLNNVTLGYSLPKKWISGANIDNVRIYVTGDNLALISARKGYDPRQSFGLVDYRDAGAYRYTSIRTISGGISLTF